MIRQYVGARYVPKFASPVEWASNTSYEALTIVTFNNASYTSKVPVPPTVGNPANNPQYWALTGNYNAQVEQYRQETIQFKNEIKTSEEAYKNEITEGQNAFKNEVTEYQNAFKNEVAEGQNNFQSALTSNYSALKQEVNNLTLSAGNPEATSAEITAARGAYSTLSERLNNSVSVFPSAQYITKENYETYLTDANAAIPNNIYRLVISAASTAFPANLPVTTNNGTYGHSSNCYLLTLVNQKMGGSLCDIQIFYDFNDSKIWSRAHNINGKPNWGAWQTLFDRSEITDARGAYSSLSERLNNSVSVFPSAQYITKENYETYLTDANAAIPNNIYRLVISAASTAFPANLPVTTNNGTYGHSSVCYLLTLINQKMGGSLCDIQIFYDFNDSKIWSRGHNINGKVGWGEWQTLYDAKAFTPRKIMHIGPDDNFAQKIIMAYEENYAEVHVDNGTYNVQDNLKAIYGSLEAQYNNNQYRNGLPLGHGIKYIFNSNAVVTLNYTGTNENVENTLSLFAAYPGNYELHGGTFITNNIRYTIHDERASSEDSYYHEYDGCRLEHTSNSGSKGYEQTIGGGLGEHGTIYIHDCFFKSITNKFEKVGTVSYHNGSDNKCKSRLVIRDNYFDLDNTLRISWYGTSDLITLWLVSNNSFGSAIEYRAETEDSTHVNMEYKAWNNEVRT